jgi:hypothetical protein
MRDAIFFAVAVVAWCAVEASCQESQTGGASGQSDLLMGEIPLQDTTGKKRDASEVASKEVEEWEKALLAAVTTPASSGAIPELGTEGAGYLAALYLLCTEKRGPCGFILESILEADLLASKQTGVARCAVMNRFWKVWIANEGDRRLQFQIPIGHAPELARFNSSVRPRFVRCKETVQAILADSKAFTQRHSADSAAGKAVAALKAILGEVQKGGIDLFATTVVTPAL